MKGIKKTTQQFVIDAQTVHGDKYIYEKTNYISSHEKVCITCKIHGDFMQRPNDHLRGSGCPQCYHMIFGVGVYDNVNKNSIARAKWRSMLNRCYYDKSLQIRQSYRHCEVCEEWLLFSNFKKWFENPINGYQEGYHLDKDILVKGNKIYSPQTCCFVPNEINSLFKKFNCKNDLPIGVHLKNGKYETNLSMYGKSTFIGLFNTVEEAFYAYKYAKERYIKSIAEKYLKEGKITEKVYNALIKYEVGIYD